MIAIMTTLNKKGQEAMLPVHPTACTDITGLACRVTCRRWPREADIPSNSGPTPSPSCRKALELAKDGIIPGGAYNNMGYLADDVVVEEGVPLGALRRHVRPPDSGRPAHHCARGPGEELLRRLLDLGVPGAASSAR